MNRNCCLTTPNLHDSQPIEPFLINLYNNTTLFNDTLFAIPSNNISHFPMENSNKSVTDNSDMSIANIIVIPLFVLTVILAGTYVVLVLCRKTLRSNKFNWLNMNVCCASAVFACIQLYLGYIGSSNTSESVLSCRSKAFIINMGTCHIMYTHCTASLCRLLSVRYPHKPLFRSRHWLLSNIGISWIIGILVALPYLFFDGFSCASDYGKRFLQIYTSLSIILLPIVIVTVCNIIIFRYVRQSSKRIHDLNHNNVNQLSKRDMYLCKIIVLTFSVFVVGWTPLFIQQLFFPERSGLPSSVNTFFKTLPPTCLLIDVVLLIYSDHPVRNLIVKVFKCQYCIK